MEKEAIPLLGLAHRVGGAPHDDTEAKPSAGGCLRGDPPQREGEAPAPELSNASRVLRREDEIARERGGERREKEERWSGRLSCCGSCSAGMASVSEFLRTQPMKRWKSLRSMLSPGPTSNSTLGVKNMASSVSLAHFFQTAPPPSSQDNRKEIR